MTSQIKFIAMTMCEAKVTHYESDKCFSSVDLHAYESAHRIPVTIPPVHFLFGPSAQTMKWAW